MMLEEHWGSFAARKTSAREAKSVFNAMLSQRGHMLSRRREQVTLRNALCKSFIIILWWESFFEMFLLDTYPVNFIKYDVPSHPPLF